MKSFNDADLKEFHIKITLCIAFYCKTQVIFLVKKLEETLILLNVIKFAYLFCKLLFFKNAFQIKEINDSERNYNKTYKRINNDLWQL